MTVFSSPRVVITNDAFESSGKNIWKFRQEHFFITENNTLLIKGYNKNDID